MSNTEDYQSQLSSIEQISDDEVKTPNMPVDRFVQKAENLYRWSLADKEKLTAAGLPPVFIDEMPARAGACREAESIWANQRKSRSEGAQAWKEQSPAAFELRDELLHAFRYAFRKEDALSARPENPIMQISHESIYKYIYNEAKAYKRSWLIKQLTRSRPKRSTLPRRKIYNGTIKDRVPIDDRPEHIEERKEIGHWEGDLMIGKDQKSAIGTLVERRLRYVMIIPLKSKKSEHVVEEFAKRLNSLPEALRRTLTYDNGIEFTMHKKFTELTKMPVYFAHPYSSWERGTNENTNGLIRRVYKKKTDFRKVSKYQWRQLEYLLNTRPGKVLNYRTSIEELKRLSA